MEFAIGDLLWIYPHDELSWAPGKIVSIEPSSYIAKVLSDPTDDSLYSIDKSSALPVHTSCLLGVNNLLDLGEFNEASLLSNIRVRYSKSEIYTSIGEPLLISVNPYQPLPIYSSQHKKFYKTGSVSSAPHLYKLAQNTLNNLRECNQSIIISGESGSGKTEAGKILLDYLAGDNQISSRVLDSNPVLESFGNAKTLKNDNSSRFGKFIELYFDGLDVLFSAKIQVYLLEKSRIVFQPEGERNYHFFYQLCCGADEADREKFKILAPDEYFYLVQGECIEIEGLDDREAYMNTIKCLKNLGFSEEDVEWVKRIVMGILYLGNVEFVGDDKAIIDQVEDFQTACELLGVDLEEFSKILITRVIVDPSNKQEIVIPQKPEQSVFTRDATAKALYTDLFAWLVEKINLHLFAKPKKSSKAIGLLDIYGFEVFDENSFEQFCINYANEKLQQHFNSHMFKLEQAEYTKEEIHWSHIHYEDNQDTVDLIEHNSGIIPLLDEQTKLTKSTDKIFLSKLYSKISNPKLSNPGVFKNEFFGIEHYAGTVFYNVAGFLEKNRDSVNPSLQEFLESSPLGFLYQNKGKRAKVSSISAVSVASQFKSQLSHLIKTLSAANPVFVRCIKPNSDKIPMVFNSVDVKNQLRCAGLLECIRIRKAGYSIRRRFEEFVKKYGVVAIGNGDLRKRCKEIVKVVKKGELGGVVETDKRVYQIGKSVVFMREEFRAALELEYSKAVCRYVTVIQKMVKGWACRRRFWKLKKAVVDVQEMWKEKKMEKIDKVEVLERIEDIGKGVGGKNKEDKHGKEINQSKGVEFEEDKDSFKDENKKNIFIENEKGKDERVACEEGLVNGGNARKKRIVRELTQGSSSVVENLHEEMKKLNLTLIKEREKQKKLEDQVGLYKEKYENSLETIKNLQSELEAQQLRMITNQSLPKQEKDKGLMRELKSKTSEIQILNLKIQSLTQQLEEDEQNLNEYKEKEAKWRKNLENEILRNNSLLEKLQQAPKISDSSPILNPDLLAELEHLRSLESTLKKDMQRLKDELDLKTQQITLLEYQRPSKDSEAKSNFTALLSKKSEKINELQSINENLKLEVGICQSKDKTYKIEIENLKKLNNEKQITIQRLESEVTELSQQLHKSNRMQLESDSLAKVEQQKQIEGLKTKIEEFTEELEEKNNELEISKEIYSVLLDILKLKNSEIEVHKQSGKSPIELSRELNVIRQREKELLHMLKVQSDKLNSA